MREQGEYDAALAKANEGLALRERSLPPDDPGIADALNLIGIIQWDQGDYDAALATNARALAMRERTFGPMHPLVVASLGNAANILRDRGDDEASLDADRRALAAFDLAVFGPESTFVAHTLSNMSASRSTPWAGRRRRSTRSIARWPSESSSFGPITRTSPSPTGIAPRLSSTLAKRWDEAIGAAKMRIEISRRDERPGVPAACARPLLVIGEAFEGKGEPDRAIPPLERALHLASAGKLPPVVAAGRARAAGPGPAGRAPRSPERTARAGEGGTRDLRLRGQDAGRGADRQMGSFPGL